MFKIVYTEFHAVYVVFCSRTPIHGLQYIVRKDISRIERWVWTLIVIAFISLMAYLCMEIQTGFSESPTVTTLVSTNYPVSNVNLPAVAICSNNKISRRKLNRFLAVMSQTYNVSHSMLVKEATWLGRLHDFSLNGDDQNLDLQHMIDGVMADNPKEWPNLRVLMQKLSVPCTELLEECYWMGEKHQCSQLFVKRATGDGFCCIFNYIDPDINSNDDHVVPLTEGEKYVTKFNINTGLKILINHMPDDYYYTEFMFEGVDIKIFDRETYPDSPLSGVNDIFVGMGSEVYLPIEASHNIAAEEVTKYHIEKRGCTFKLDGDHKFSTLSSCLLDCKTKAVKALCNCIPFMLPYSASDNSRICNIVDLPCLSKYKGRLSTIYPADFEGDGLELEKEDSLNCKCYPSCSLTNYDVTTNYARLYLEGNNTAAKTRSFVHLFYGKEFINLYETDIVMYWFELISNIGGICGILMGVSVISLIELLYHFFFFVYNIYFGEKFRP